MRAHLQAFLIVIGRGMCACVDGYVGLCLHP